MRPIDRAGAELRKARRLRDLGRYDDARRHVEAAVTIVGGSRAGGDRARLRHETFVQAGGIHVLCGDYRRARTFFSRARHVAERHALGGQATARALNGLGIVAKYAGQWAEGDDHYRRALRTLGPDRARTNAAAAVLHNLGGLEHARGRFARAERWAREGLALRERLCGVTAVETAADVAGLAAIVHARGSLAEAARLYRRALAILRRRLGAAHFEVAFNLGQMAALEHSRGRLLASRHLYDRALPRLERSLGRDHPVVARLVANLAELRADMGDHRDAQALRRRAMQSLRRTLRARHPDVLALGRDLSR